METQEMFLCRPEEPMVIFLFSPLKKIQQYFLNSILSHVVFIYFWPHLEAYGISLPLPGVELRPQQ